MTSTAASPGDIVIDFASLLVGSASDILSTDEITKVIGVRPGRSGFLGLGPDAAARALAADDDASRKSKIAALLSSLANALGSAAVDTSLETIYTKLERKYSPVLANASLLPLIPDAFLEKFRLSFFSKEELEALVLEKTKANKELIELDRRKSEFLSVVAHQLRTPLSGMKWALNLLLREHPEPLSESQKKLLASCEEGNERMLTIVNSMLRADRVSAGGAALTRVPTDLVALVTAIIKESELLAAKRSVTLAFTHDPHVPLVPLDEEMMRFALQNLIDNALYYSHVGGTVAVSLTFSEGKVSVAVADTGIGIPLDQQPYIFSRFFRAKNAIATEPNGTGLGLSIVKDVIEKHGGTISFTSTENVGTTFYVTLAV